MRTPTLGIMIAVIAASLIFAGAFVWRARQSASVPGSTEEKPVAEFVGSAACRDCHTAAADQWKSSQHAAAMAEASDASVLGRFDNASITHSNVTTTFFRRDGRFVVETDGPDGRPADFEIAFTFGITPLQQYLVRFPGGRLQALGLAWDSRPASNGGQRWFPLYPNETIRHDDPLHWTGIHQNWNFMCADCHSTNVRKGYDPSRHEFRTTWSEISVGCESCHGPGSRHVSLARAGTISRSDTGLTAVLDERRSIAWRVDSRSGVPVRSAPRATNREIDVCARCHSRRAQLTDDWHAGQPFENGFRPSTLEPSLYYPDGQQREEVYTVGSFLQSRMHAAGVTCSDCHNPHSGKLRVSGNATCTQCHPPQTYDTRAHFFHQPNTVASTCTSCHMQTTTYMVIDPRHDHSFRIPRPDRTVSMGVPNPCTTCHAAEGAAWAAKYLEQRNGRSAGGYQRFAETFAAADRHEPVAADVARIASDASYASIVRASALARLSTSANTASMPLEDLLRHADPIVRRTAIELLAARDAGTRVRFATPLLSDPIRTVRSEAARALADVAERYLPAESQQAFTKAFDELVDEYRFNADRPQALAALGGLLLTRGRVKEAEAALIEALKLDSAFTPAYINLADLRRVESDERGAEEILRRALAASPSDGAVRHTLGLALVRQKRMPEAIEQLRSAVRLAPDDARYAYALAVALHDTGHASEALDVLAAAHKRHPTDADILYVLALYSRQAGRTDDARRYTSRLERLDPTHPGLADLTAPAARER
jgi:Flp pilus assembly protein TadD